LCFEIAEPLSVGSPRQPARQPSAQTRLRIDALNRESFSCSGGLLAKRRRSDKRGNEKSCEKRGETRNAAPQRHAILPRTDASLSWSREKNKFRATNNPVASGNYVHRARSEEHTSELQSRFDLVCRLL